MDQLQKSRCDVLDFRVAYATDESEAKEGNSFKPIIVNNEDILLDYLYRGQTEKCPFSVCRKIYRKDLYNDIKFPEGKVNEDIVTNFRILENCDKLVHISNVGYYYFQDNSESITSGKLNKKDFDLIFASKELCALAQHYPDRNLINLANVKLARSYFSLLAKAATGGVENEINKEDIKYLTKNLRKNYKLLIRSPMPLNRKLFVTLASINYNCIGLPYSFLRKIKRF
jgi:hypothetical protein